MRRNRTLCGRRGIAVVEFALFLPLLLLFLAGAVDYAMLMRTGTSVADAARAGAAYGSMSVANATDNTGIQNAALQAASDVTGLTATPVRTCQCSNGASINCGGSCPSGKVQMYIQVIAQATCPFLFSYPGVPFSGNVSTVAYMRVQ